MDDLIKSLKELGETDQQEMIQWFKEKIYKLKKERRDFAANYRPPVKRREIVWVDFGVNVGQELKGKHPAIVLYSNDKSGTAVVIPLTSKNNTADFVINLGEIVDMEIEFSYAKVDQITTVSKLRIISKKNPANGRWYSHVNKITGKFCSPRATADQMDLIDKKMAEYRIKSAKF